MIATGITTILAEHADIATRVTDSEGAVHIYAGAAENVAGEHIIVSQISGPDGEETMETDPLTEARYQFEHWSPSAAGAESLAKLTMAALRDFEGNAGETHFRVDGVLDTRGPDRHPDLKLYRYDVDLAIAF